MKNLYKKELNYYLNNPIGYIVIILFTIFSNFLFIKDLFAIGSASMQPFFAMMPWLFLIFIPALTMRVFSEEKKSNTIEVLLTQPISETEIVISKFLAIFTLVVVALVLTLGLPISLSFMSNLYLPEILVGYIGEMLLAVSLIGIGIFFSSTTKNQIVAFLFSMICIFILLVIGSDFVGGILPKTVIDMLNYFSPIYHLDEFVKGLIDLRGVVYFLSLATVFALLTIINVERRS